MINYFLLLLKNNVHFFSFDATDEIHDEFFLVVHTHTMRFSLSLSLPPSFSLSLLLRNITVIRLDDISSLFSNHHHGSEYIAGCDVRHDGCIHDS